MWTVEARQRYAWTRRSEGFRFTDTEWAIIEPLLPEHASMGRPWKHTLRTILDSILHLLRTGCLWSALPEWAPPRSTVYEWFRRSPKVAGWRRSITRADSRARAPGARAEPDAWDRGQPDGQGNGPGRPARVRRGQEDQWPQTPHPGG